MVIWDFNENKNYVIIDNYKVLNFDNAEAASDLLEQIDILILKTLISIEVNEQRTPELDLLITTPYYLQEMQLPKDQGEIIFEGLNKPKEIHLTRKQNIGVDGKLRAKYRVIFLTIRNNNNKLKKISSLKKLIAHELTHTAMNHVLWREDDHDDKFNKYNKIILTHINRVS